MAVEINVSTETHPNNLAGSIVAAYGDGSHDVTMVAIGPVAVSQAIKAIHVANRFFAVRNVFLAVIPGMETRKILDRDKKSRTPWVVVTLRLINIAGKFNAVQNSSDASASAGTQETD